MSRLRWFLATGFAVTLAVLLSASASRASELVVKNDSRHHIIVHVQHESQWRDDDAREWQRHHWRELGSVRGQTRETFEVEHGRYRIAARDEHGHYWPPKEIYIRRGHRFIYTFYVD